MPTLTIQPSDIDTWFTDYTPDTNYGNETYLRVRHSDAYKARSILKFDFSSLPPGATIISATLSLYYYATFVGDPVGRTYWVYELTQTGWVELQATWNIYKTGSNWVTAGGDYITDNGASLAVPASFGWMSWNVLALVQHFQSAHAEVAHFLIKDTEIGSGIYVAAHFYSNNYITDTSLRPKLVIEYEVLIPKLFFGHG